MSKLFCEKVMEKIKGPKDDLAIPEQKIWEIYLAKYGNNPAISFELFKDGFVTGHAYGMFKQENGEALQKIVNHISDLLKPYSK